MSHAIETHQTLRAVDKDGRGLQITFIWQRDRFTHRILAVDDKREVVLLESLDGTSADQWPLSPPLQSLSVEQREAGRQVALLVGMAGRSHWSLSVETRPDERTLVFDAACRVHKPPDMLGSTYRTMFKSSALDLQSFAIGHDCQFDTTATINSKQADIHRPEGRFTVSIDVSAASLPATFRWQYAISRR